VWDTTIAEVARVWSSATFVRTFAVHPLHLHLTLALSLLLDHCTAKDITRLNLLSPLIDGVQSHLMSTIQVVRLWGMMVGEQFSTLLHSENALFFEELHAQLDTLEAAVILRELRAPPAACEPSNSSSAEVSLSSVGSSFDHQLLDEGEQAAPVNGGASDTTTVTASSGALLPDPDTPLSMLSDSDDSDSDDGLEAYDLRDELNTVRSSSEKSDPPPAYLRQCLLRLRKSDETADGVEETLRATERLIRAGLPDLADVATALTRILLHMSNTLELDSFPPLRHKALVALVVCAPLPVVRYLTQEFYERNYSLSQRMDILTVLVNGASELANVTEQGKLTREPKVLIRDESEKRSRHARSVATSLVNRFTPLATYFFFPLLNGYDNTRTCFDLLGEDSPILTRLVWTLGVFVEHTGPGNERLQSMAIALAEAVLVLRYHAQALVRRSCLFAVAAIASHLGTSERGSQLLPELRSWLEHTAVHDVDPECQMLASQLVQLFRE